MYGDAKWPSDPLLKLVGASTPSSSSCQGTGPQPQLGLCKRPQNVPVYDLPAIDKPMTENAIEILKGISPVAWRNVNLIGFEYSSTPSLAPLKYLNIQVLLYDPIR